MKITKGAAEPCPLNCFKMIDYLEATKQLQGKDKPFLGHLHQEAAYQSGWNKYLLNGCKSLEILHNKPASLIRIKGSLAYFYQGHNFSFTNRQFVEAMNYINDILHLNNFDALVDLFEFGQILEVEDLPRNFILNHRERPKSGLLLYENPKDRGNFRRWEAPEIRLKMYDAGKNIQQKQDKEMQELIQAGGWNPKGSHLKFEAHYKKPEALLNKGRGMMLADLVNPNWNQTFRADLYNQYKRLIPMGKIEFPDNKKDLSTSDLLMLTLADTNLNEGNTLQEVKKMLFDRINAIPEEVLTDADKKARKRQISTLLQKIKVTQESRWDLTEKLKAALELDEA
jgi:hypothetical protein